MRKECIIIKNDIKARTNLSVRGKEQLKIDTYDQLLKKITGRIECGVAKAADEIRKSQLATYWDAGRYIVEYEQNGKKHAEYGLELLKKLATDLTLRFGRGYSRPNLYNMRKFYQLYPGGYEEISLLTWSHVCELIRIEDEVERQFYTNQCIDEKWNVRTLQRQKKSALFLRLATTKNKNEILALAKHGIEIDKPEDIVKNTYTLEFLQLNNEAWFSETELEQKIIDNLQSFLMELGKGFTFVKQQYPININNKVYHCDLVFYHRILKCFVLIDLKIDDVQHEDVGQMNMYMGYFAMEENEQDDNPPIGIILSRNKDELLIKYSTYGMESNLFVSKYELYLPDVEELKRIVNNTMDGADESESV